jgi:hypothetical protein
MSTSKIFDKLHIISDKTSKTSGNLPLVLKSVEFKTTGSQTYGAPRSAINNTIYVTLYGGGGNGGASVLDQSQSGGGGGGGSGQMMYRKPVIVTPNEILIINVGVAMAATSVQCISGTTTASAGSDGASTTLQQHSPCRGWYSSRGGNGGTGGGVGSGGSPSNVYCYSAPVSYNYAAVSNSNVGYTGTSVVDGYTIHGSGGGGGGSMFHSSWQTSGSSGGGNGGGGGGTGSYAGGGGGGGIGGGNGGTSGSAGSAATANSGAGGGGAGGGGYSGGNGGSGYCKIEWYELT